MPIAHLAGFKGVLQVDGYAGYRALAGKGGVTLAFCRAHLRRRFYERAVAEASPSTMQLGQADRVPTIGLDPIARFAWDQ